MNCEIRIGTSGYHYKHWQGPFYPARTSASQMLHYYARYFDTVELNNSFYRLPAEAAFDDWRKATPPNFVFAVKASRFLTHNQKLKDPQPALTNVLPRVEHLGAKLGPILFQLPPKWRVNYKRLKALLEALPPGFRYVFELRDRTWITPDIDELLASFHAAFCILRTRWLSLSLDRDDRLCLCPPAWPGRWKVSRQLRRDSPLKMAWSNRGLESGIEGGVCLL
jgi:uncharacterized protein YecE (DUF72 family)